MHILHQDLEELLQLRDGDGDREVNARIRHSFDSLLGSVAEVGRAAQQQPVDGEAGWEAAGPSPGPPTPWQQEDAAQQNQTASNSPVAQA